MRPRLSALIAAAVVAGCVASTPLRESPPGAMRLLPAEPAASVLYVALGDSTVEGVGASSPARNYVGQSRTAQRGLSPRAGGEPRGRRRHGLRVLSRQLPRAIKLRPDLVTLSVGPNDITGKRDLESYARDIDAILRILTRQTGAVVVVNLIPDLTVTPRFRGKEIEARVRERVVAFNEILALQARGYGAEVVDLYTASQREVPARPDLIGPDRYHPSDDGYARWAELMWAGIAARIMR